MLRYREMFQGQLQWHALCLAQPGDVLKVERSGTIVTYWVNSTMVYTSTVPSSGALIADAALNPVNATLMNVTIYQ